MEEDISGTSFSDTDLNEPRTSFADYLDTICPYYLMYGMTWDEFWNGSLDRLPAYWQKHQFEIEARNQELWLQGLYNKIAIAAALDKRNKYPEKPQRITEMTDAEKDAEAKARVAKLKEQLLEIKRRSDERNKSKSKGV